METTKNYVRREVGSTSINRLCSEPPEPANGAPSDQYTKAAFRRKRMNSGANPAGRSWGSWPGGVGGSGVVWDVTQKMPPIKHDEPTVALKDPLLFNLVYCSRARTGVKEAQVDAIIATSRRRNPVLGITGLLVFGSGVFFQWIEGPKAEVLGLMKLIEADPRHETVVVLSTSEEVRERVFPTWDMELVGTQDIQEVLKDALETAEDKKSVDALELLLAQCQAQAQSN